MQKSISMLVKQIKDNPAEDIQLVLKETRDTIDPRRYNLPTGTDIAVIIPTERNDISKRDVVICKNSAKHATGKAMMKISTEHPIYDPLMYVLMFPYGDKDGSLGAIQQIKRAKSVAQCNFIDTGS